MRHVLIFFFLCSIPGISGLYSQEICGADDYQTELLQNLEYKRWYENVTKEVTKRVKEGTHARSSNTVMIPVAIHFNGNVTDDDRCCLINASLAQINVLNEDFAALNNDISIYRNLTSASFACSNVFPLSALFDGTNFQFFIATSNHPPSSGLNDGDYAITVGQALWPNAGLEWSGYLNIFVEDGLEYQGRGPISGAANPDGDGIHIRTDVFGGPGLSCNSGVQFNTHLKNHLGRVGTHEVGHYFGLSHIFLGCSDQGDGIADTPDQSEYNVGVPTLENPFDCATTAINSCSSKDFYMNHMDYTDDETRVMFTTGQAAVMDVVANMGDWNTGMNSVSVCGGYPIPELSAYQLSSICPSIEVDLSTINLVNDLPCNTQLIWSTDSNPSDGIDDDIGTVVTSSGNYYAYFFNEMENCYSSPSAPVLVVASCCTETDDVIITNEYEIFNSPVGFGGNVIVPDGKTLIINTSVEFGEYKKLIIEDGGTVQLSGASAILTDCPGALRWDGINVQSGGTLIVSGGAIHSALHAVHALAGSYIDISALEAFGGGGYDNSRTGIWLDGNVNLAQLTAVKILSYHTGIHCIDGGGNYYNIDQGEISDCFSGISLRNAPARINGFNISAKSRAIDAVLSPGTLIENNELNAPPNGDTYGILMSWCDAAVVKSNTIGTDSNAPSTGISLFSSNGGTIRDINIIRGERTGIFAFGTDFSIIKNDISVLSSGNFNRGALTLMYGNGNQILNNYIDAQNVTFGIDTKLCKKTRIKNNDITTSFNAAYHRTAGIKSEGSTAETIADNKVTGNGNTDGIIATNTVGNTYKCNHAVVSGSKEALSVLYNSQGQSVRGNTLSANGNGNDLLIRSIIGPQVHEGNEFVGGNAFAEDVDIAFDSRFFVNSIYSFHMPANPDPATGWFMNEPDIHNYFDECINPGPNWIPFWDDEESLCAYYLEMVNDYDHGSKEYALMIQAMLRYSQYRSDYDLPACIAADPLLPSCWAQIIEAEAIITSSGSHLSPANDSLRQKIESLSSAYEAGTGNQYLIANKALISNFAASLESAKAEHDLKVNQAESELATINCTGEIISVALSILQQYIDYLKTEDKSTFNYSTLIEYSRLCADDYGPYVQLARGIVYPITDEYFDQYDDCRSEVIEPRSASSIIGNYGTFVHPNPSKGWTMVSFANAASGKIEVTDISGRAITNIEFKDEANVNLNLSDYPGLNLIRIYHEDGTVEVLKHISTK